MKQDFSSVQGKVAIVTGASRGIGRAIAQVYGVNGIRVVCAARSADQGQAVADAICKEGGEAIFVRTDCSQPEDIRALVDAAVKKYGRLDGVVSNAGIGMGGSPLHEYEMEDYDRIFALNSKGVFAGMKYGAEAIFQTGSTGGFLINVASVAGLVAQKGQALYSATKHGVVGMTKAAALDYAPYGITVNAICPGFFRTKMAEVLIDTMGEEKMAGRAPLRRLGDSEDLKGLTVLLASDAGKHITGQWMAVDGGVSAILG